MKQENQRIAIAEVCGWTRMEMGCRIASGKQLLGAASNLMGTPPCDKCAPEDKQGWEIVPDFPNDLNAMHEAEKAILNKAGLVPHDLGVNLLTICTRDGKNKAYYATAAQRAEAFLRTVGKWEK